jgi:hypothetical protein
VVETVCFGKKPVDVLALATKLTSGSNEETKSTESNNNVRLLQIHVSFLYVGLVFILFIFRKNMDILLLVQEIEP